MIDKKRLCKFLVEAKKSTYAAGERAKKIVEDDKSTTLFFEDGNLKYHDNYFGGEPFAILLSNPKFIYINNHSIIMRTKLPKPFDQAIIYDDSKLYACLANYPIVKGHTVIVWKKSVFDLHLLSK